jgi:hypothetical protein
MRGVAGRHERICIVVGLRACLARILSTGVEAVATNNMVLDPLLLGQFPSLLMEYLVTRIFVVSIFDPEREPVSQVAASWQQRRRLSGILFSRLSCRFLGVLTPNPPGNHGRGV